MSWRGAVIRLSTHQGEGVQKGLAEVVERRTQAEIRLALLEAQAQAEIEHARQGGEAAMRIGAYLAGVRIRRAALEGDIAQIGLEEAGARDALAEAFEAMK